MPESSDMDMAGKPASAPDELKDVIAISGKEKFHDENNILPNGILENNVSAEICLQSCLSPSVPELCVEGKTANLNYKSSQKSATDKTLKATKTTKKYQKSSLAIANKTNVKSTIASIPGSSQTSDFVNNKFEGKKHSKTGVKKQPPGTNAQKKECFKFPMNRSRWCDGKGDKPFKCNICEKLYKYMFSLKRHYLRIHINEEYISEADLANCKINVNGDRREKNKDVVTPPNRKKQKTTGECSDGMPGLYKCSFHKVRYDLETELKHHYTTVFHPKKEEFICKVCKEIFETKAKLCDHVKVCPQNGEEVANHCKKCKVTFQSSADYEYHLSIHGNGKFCKYCNKEFSNIANRKRHENLHDGSQSFKCKHCEFSSQGKKDLNIHIRKLHMDLYYRCDKCPKYGIAKIYATKSLLQAHVVERHSEKKELATKTATSAKASPKMKGIQNHLKDVPPNAVTLKSSTPETKSIASEAKNIGSKSHQSSPSSCVCNLCKKAFPDVRAMLRHKNLAHKKRTTYKRKVKKTIKVKTLTKKPTKKEIEEETLRFYMNVSYNIADNLLHYVDGTIHQLHLSEESSLNKRTIPDPESWNLNFSDQLRRPCSSSVTVTKVPENVRPPEIFIATGLNKVDDCPNKIQTLEDSTNLTELKNGFRLNLLNNDMYFSKQAETRCFCHACLVEIKEAQKRNVEERKKWIEHKKVSVYVCLVCKEPFNSDCDFDEHCYNNHPLVDTQSILVVLESDKTKPPVIPYDLSRKVNPTPHGLLTSDSQCFPIALKTQSSSKCTKCKTIVSPSFLHEHILRCGGNESYFVKKHFRKRIRRKRIKNTMKHRLDLTIKQLPSGERRVYKDGRIQKTKFKSEKNYFSFKNGKSFRGPFASVKETTPPCSACNKRFSSQAQLKNHQCSADKLKRGQKSINSKDASFQGNVSLNLSQKELCKRDLTASFQTTPVSKERHKQTGNYQQIKPPHDISSKISDERLNVNSPSPQPCHVSKTTNNANSDSAMDLSFSKKPSVLSVTPDKHSRLLSPTANKELMLSSTANKKLTKSPIDALKETVDRLTNKEITKVAIENTITNKSLKNEVGNKDKITRESIGISMEQTTCCISSPIVRVRAKKNVREENMSPSKDISCDIVKANKNTSIDKLKFSNDGKSRASKTVTKEILIDSARGGSKVKKDLKVVEEKKGVPLPPNKDAKSINVILKSTNFQLIPNLIISPDSPTVEKETDLTTNSNNQMKKSKKSLDEALKKITKIKPQIFNSAVIPSRPSVSLGSIENNKSENLVSMAQIQPSVETSNISSKKDGLVDFQTINVTKIVDPRCDLPSHEKNIIPTANATKPDSTDSNASDGQSTKLEDFHSEENVLSVSKRSRKKLTPSKIVQSKSDESLPGKNADNNLKETINNKIKGLSQSIAKQLFTLDNRSNDSSLNVGTVTEGKLSNQSRDPSLPVMKISHLISSEPNKKVITIDNSKNIKAKTEDPLSSNDVKKTYSIATNLDSSKRTGGHITISEAIVKNSITNKKTGALEINDSVTYKKTSIPVSDPGVMKKSETQMSNQKINTKIGPIVSNSEVMKRTGTLVINSQTHKNALTLISNLDIDKKIGTLASDSDANKKSQSMINSSEMNKKIETVVSNSETNKDIEKHVTNAKITEKTEIMVTSPASKKSIETALSPPKFASSMNTPPANSSIEVSAQQEASFINSISCSPVKTLSSQTPSNSFKTIQAAENKSEALPVLQAPVLFLSNECLNSEVASTQDRDSPTLEVLVSSVTQNLENFDEQSGMDDDKFSISDPTEEGQSKISKNSFGGSLNFTLIMPEGGKLGASHPLSSFPNETVKVTEQHSANQFCMSSSFSNVSQNSTNVIPDDFSEDNSINKNVSGVGFTKNILNSVGSSNNASVTSASIFTVPFMSTPIKGFDNLAPLDVSLVPKETSKSNVSNTHKGETNLLNVSSSSDKFEKKKVDHAIDVNRKSIENESTAFKGNEKAETITLSAVSASISSVVNTQKSFENEISLLHKVSKTYSKGMKTPADKKNLSKSKKVDAPDLTEKAMKTKSKLSLGKKAKKNSSNELDPPVSSKNECSSVCQSEAAPDSVSHLRAFRREQNDHQFDANEAKTAQINTYKSDGKQKTKPVVNKDNLSQNLESVAIYDTSTSFDQKDIKKELEAEAIIIKKEQEGAKKHACPYCMLEFAYLSNFRRHTRQCRSKDLARRQKLPLESSSQFSQHLPKKEEVEESMLNLLRHQTRQNQMIQKVLKSDDEKEIVPPEPKKLQTYTCPFCHKIFLKLFEQVKHLTNAHLLSNEESKVYLNTQKADQNKLNEGETSSAITDDNVSEENVSVINVDQSSLSEVPNLKGVSSVAEEVHVANETRSNSSNLNEDMKKEAFSNIPMENALMEGSTQEIKDPTELVKPDDANPSIENTISSQVIESNNLETPVFNLSFSNEKELNSRQKSKIKNSSSLSQDLPAFDQGRGRKKKSLDNELSLETKCLEKQTVPCLKEESSSDSTDIEKDSASPKNIMVSKLKDTISHKMRLLTSKCPTPGSSTLENSTGIKKEDSEARTNSDSNSSCASRHAPVALLNEQPKIDINSNTLSDAPVEKEQLISLPHVPKRGRGRKSAPNLSTSPDSKPKKGRKKRFSDTNSLETPTNIDLMTSTQSSESPKQSKLLSASENDTTKIISSPKKRKVIRKKATDTVIHIKTDNNIPHIGVKDFSSTSLPSTSSLSNSSVKRLRRSRFPNYCDSESSFSTAVIPYDHSDSDDFVSSPEKRPIVKKKVLQKVCPICKKKFTASLERNRHVQLVHSRKGLETEEVFTTPPVQISENKTKKEVESPKNRTSFMRQCAKPLPPMKRKYEKQPSKDSSFKKLK